MKKLCLLLLPLLVVYCANEPAASSTPAHSSTAAPLAAQTAASADNAQSATSDAVGYSPLEVVMRAPEATAGAGETICLPITVANFKDIIAMQYTIRWDKNILNFQSVKGFNLPKLGNANFGAHRTSEGLLTFLWLEEMLKGVTKADGETIYEVCFIVKGKAGQSSPLNFSGEPTAIEVINAQDQMLNFKPVAGKVEIK